MRVGATGATVLSFTVTVDGSVKDVKIVQSSGVEDLDREAADCAAARWHYKPTFKDGVPVEVTQSAKIIWKLAGTK